MALPEPGDGVATRISSSNMVASLGGAITSQSSPLLSVPLEVLLDINRYFTTAEYGNLRLTCKHIENQLVHAFATEYFQKKQFMFTEFSLQALVDISQSRFASTVKHLVFGLEQPPNPPRPLTNPPTAVSPPRSSRRDEIVRFNKQVIEWLSHPIFLNNGQHVEMLAQAFSSLPYLETIGMRDFNSHSRFRDAPSDQWTSYGVPTYFRETGTRMIVVDGKDPLPSRNSHLRFNNRVFQDILRSAGKASIHLKDLQVILRSYRLADSAFLVPKYLEPTVAPVLANLRTLFLDLERNPVDPYVYAETPNCVEACPRYHMMKFLSMTLKLEHLRLNLNSHCGESTYITSWLSQSPSTTSNPVAVASIYAEPEPVVLKHLMRLDIGRICMEPKTMHAIIHKYRATLRVISLHKVTFLHKKGVTAANGVNLWAKFFHSLLKLDLKLVAINMSFLYQHHPPDYIRRYVTFKNTPCGHTKNWTGDNPWGALRDFEEFVTIDGLKAGEDEILQNMDISDSETESDWVNDK